MKNVCVFLSADDQSIPEFGAATKELGEIFATLNLNLVYGGGNTGLMGVLAKTVVESGGKITSIIPSPVRHLPIWFKGECEVVYSENLSDRKIEMEKRSDAFIALPGGFGTLNEMTEIQLNYQLGQHAKPFVYLNLKGFYEPLKVLYSSFFKMGCANLRYKDMVRFASNPSEAVSIITSSGDNNVLGKWS